MSEVPLYRVRGDAGLCPALKLTGLFHAPGVLTLRKSVEVRGERGKGQAMEIRMVAPWSWCSLTMEPPCGRFTFRSDVIGPIVFFS